MAWSQREATFLPPPDIRALCSPGSVTHTTLCGRRSPTYQFRPMVINLRRSPASDRTPNNWDSLEKYSLGLPRALLFPEKESDCNLVLPGGVEVEDLIPLLLTKVPDQCPRDQESILSDGQPFPNVGLCLLPEKQDIGLNEDQR